MAHIQNSQEETSTGEATLPSNTHTRFCSTTMHTTAANPRTYLPPVSYTPSIDVNPHLRYTPKPPVKIPLTTWERGAIVYREAREAIIGTGAFAMNVYQWMTCVSIDLYEKALRTANWLTKHTTPSPKNQLSQPPLEERLQDA